MSADSSRTASARQSSEVDAEKASASAPHHADDKPATTLQEDVHGAGLDWVFQRHGRIDLIPMPSDDPNDPLNWSSFRKHALLLQVAFHAMLGPFSAAAVIPAFEAFVVEFGCSITQASYYVSVPIVFLGTFPLLWAPISARIGRRPVFIASALISACMHFAGAYCTSYGTLMITRVFQGIFLCPPQSIGAQTVAEIFFQHEKGAKLGIWALLTTLGPPLAPLIMGAVVYHLSWHWIFYLLSIINLVQFFLYIILGPETLYDRPDRSAPSTTITTPTNITWASRNLTVRRWSKVPWSAIPIEVVRPLGMALQLNVMLPALAYAITFCYTNVLLTVEIPSLLGRKMGLNAQQIGLQFIAPLVGAVLGEPIAGWGSDKFVAWRTGRAGGQREPEMRLPFALPGFIISAVGLIVFGVELQNAKPNVWVVNPIIGSAIALFGLQLVTTVCFTYAIESQPASLQPRVPLFVAFFRQLFAFVGPFYLTLPFEEWGDAKAAGFLASLVGGVGFILVFACLVYGKNWRAKAAAAAQ